MLMAWRRDHPTRAGCVLSPGWAGSNLCAPHRWHLEPDQVCRVCGGAGEEPETQECGIGAVGTGPAGP